MEVICIKEHSADSQWLMQTHGIVPPKIGDIFHVAKTSEYDGKAWYAFSEYPDTFISGGYYTHWFESVYFGVIDKLQAEIDAALAAPKPKELIKEPDFKLNEKQIKERLDDYKRFLMLAKTQNDFCIFRDLVNKYYLKLQNITHNA